MSNLTAAKVIYAREYWTGDSRDGRLVNGDGYHYYRMSANGMIEEAYEYYELDDGTAVVSPLPEMGRINWYEDLGYEDLEVLDMIDEPEFQRVRDLMAPTA